MLTIIAAMEQELVSIRRALRVRGSASCASEPPPPELHVTGIGKERVRASIKRLLDSRQRSEPDRLLLLGFAGGVDPALKSGDLVLSNRYYRADVVGNPPPNPPLPKGGLRESPLPKGVPGKSSFGNGGFRRISLSASEQERDFLGPDSNMWRQAIEAASEAGLPLFQGSSLTVDRVIATPEAKKAAHSQYQVDTVNMEDYWAAEAAAEAGVPFLSVRAVLDPAHQGLPSYLIGLSERQDQVMRRILTRPWQVPALLRLARQAKAAQGSLTRFSFAFIDHQLSARDSQPAVRQ
jgi:adenosylhomocysteine nucleosidase